MASAENIEQLPISRNTEGSGGGGEENARGGGKDR